MAETKKVVEEVKTVQPTVSKREALKILFRGCRTPILMVGAAVTGAILGAKALSAGTDGDGIIDVNEVTAE